MKIVNILKAKVIQKASIDIGVQDLEITLKILFPLEIDKIGNSFTYFK